MKFNTKKFFRNLPFLALCTISLIVILALTLLLNSKDNNLDEEELQTGDTNITNLVINEVMSSNKGTITDSNGSLYDYVELYNGNDHSVSLKNYGLSDDASEIKYTFSDLTIEAKGYLVIFLSGTSEDKYHVPFKLKASGGETLALFKSNGKILDAVETVSLVKDTSMARNTDGKWVVQTSPTPGFSNTVDGHAAFIKSLSSTEEGLIKMTEILANNKGNFKDSYGEFSGYVEITNTSDQTVNLENYNLSNSLSVVYKWQFPSIKLSSGEQVVVFTSNRNVVEGEELHTSFKLDSLNGVVVLTNNNGKIIDQVSYTNLANGTAYVKQDDSFLESNVLSPGFSNTTSGVKSFQKKYMVVSDELIINEVMNNNYSYLPQNGGNYYDWIELYNNSGETIKLNDYCLTTNLDIVCKYTLPNVELEKGDYYIIMASGDEDLSNNSYKHANFNLSDTQSLYLTKSKKVVDSMYVSNIPKGYSMGKSGSSGLYYFSKPTPGKKNGSGAQEISYAPHASVETGIYNDVKSLSVKLIGSGKIYYTTDGSEPTRNSKVYSSPLTIKSTTVLRMMSFESGKIKSTITSYSYIVNEEHTIPIMSLIVDPSDLKSLHNNAWTEGYQKQAYAQYIELDGSGFSEGVGLKLFGGSTRGHAKRSYEIKFKKEYGSAQLHYKVFDNIDSSVFESLVLRTGSQDEMGSASKKTLIRDIVGTALVEEYTTVDVQAYKPVAMYINGKYWGLYFVREKIDETLVANHYNVNATKTNTDLLRIDSQVKSGTAKKYNKLISFINNNSLSKSSNYNEVEELVDIENLCDFWIAETWTANNDIVNVRYFSNSEVDGGKWKFILYDLDFAFYNVDRNYYLFSTNTSGMTSIGYSTFLLRNLMKSSEFKETYLERLSYNLKNTWSAKNVNKKIDEVIDEIGIDEIKRNLSRWGMSYSSWQSNIKYLRNYANKRGSYMISQAKSYFNLSSSEVKKYFGDIE